MPAWFYVIPSCAVMMAEGRSRILPFGLPRDSRIIELGRDKHGSHFWNAWESMFVWETGNGGKHQPILRFRDKLARQSSKSIQFFTIYINDIFFKINLRTYFMVESKILWNSLLDYQKYRTIYTSFHK